MIELWKPLNPEIKTFGTTGNFIQEKKHNEGSFHSYENRKEKWPQKPLIDLARLITCKIS